MTTTSIRVAAAACLAAAIAACGSSSSPSTGGTNDTNVNNTNANGNGNEHPVGWVEPAAVPGMDAANALVDGLGLSSDEVVIAYYRPDGNYQGWQVWLWNAVAQIQAYDLTVAGGVAYYRAPKSSFFSPSVRTVSLSFRDDADGRDPATSVTLDVDVADRVLVVSGRTLPYPIVKGWPRILSAGLYENGIARYTVRVHLSNRVQLPATAGDGGFTLSGGLTVTDAFAYDDRDALSSRTHTLTDDVVLAYGGSASRLVSYTLSHAAFANVEPVDFSLLPVDAPALDQAVVDQLPSPIVDDHPGWVDLYWAAWRFMHEKITAGDPALGFEPLYIDEGFNENIYQWDSNFMVAYAVYGLDAFPVMATLDNFYDHQAASGYICRCYNQYTGNATGAADINPPLFAWMEWRYYRMTGDASRLARVLPKLDAYFQWVKANARSQYSNGLYWITNFGSGMDNSPREPFVQQGAWVDLSAQQALAALHIARLAQVAGDTTRQTAYQAEYDALKAVINSYLWKADAKAYYDRKQDGTFHVRNTIASFWPLVAEIPDATQAADTIAAHLKNPAEFYRPHLFPTLAANDPSYDASGHYWLGGVWAPTDFAVIKGVALTDPQFAHEAAANHVDQMSQVYAAFDPLGYTYAMPSLTDSNIPRNADGVHQIWEAYSPEATAPATRWDGTLLTRQKFCGWSGAGPVALLVENVLGLDLDAPADTVTWDVRLLGRHGLQRFKLGPNRIDLVAAARTAHGDPIVITGTAQDAFRLVVKESGVQRLDQSVGPGAFSVTAPAP